jgi:hypothetical protein
LRDTAAARSQRHLSRGPRAVHRTYLSPRSESRGTSPLVTRIVGIQVGATLAGSWLSESATRSVRVTVCGPGHGSETPSPRRLQVPGKFVPACQWPARGPSRRHPARPVSSRCRPRGSRTPAARAALPAAPGPGSRTPDAARPWCRVDTRPPSDWQAMAPDRHGLGAGRPDSRSSRRETI